MPGEPRSGSQAGRHDQLAETICNLRAAGLRFDARPAGMQSPCRNRRSVTLALAITGSQLSCELPVPTQPASLPPPCVGSDVNRRYSLVPAFGADRTPCFSRRTAPAARTRSRLGGDAGISGCSRRRRASSESRGASGAPPRTMGSRRSLPVGGSVVLRKLLTQPTGSGTGRRDTFVVTWHAACVHCGHRSERMVRCSPHHPKEV